ncbi:MAG: MCE family protein [Sphingobium sp.]|nr:MCE family protein [Sphingobium sp.]
METRSNNVFVGAVVLLLLALIVGGAFWFSRVGEGNKREYDIFFKQSVNGLNKGSSVTYSGVQSGQVKEIVLWDKDPEFVRVRIVVGNDTPVLQGTTATINGVGFTGVSEVQLGGGVRGAPPIECPHEHSEAVCPEGVPVIPTKPGALGELLNNAPELLNRLMTLTERLTEVLNDQNQKHLAGILENVDRLSGNLADSGPELRATIAQAHATLDGVTKAAESVAATSASLNGLVNSDGKPLVADLRETLRQARVSLDSLDATMKEAKPGVTAFSHDTMPQVSLLVRDLRQMAQQLRSVTEKINQQGAASLVGSPALPDYKK